jgi:hypothetical protein
LSHRPAPDGCETAHKALSFRHNPDTIPREDSSMSRHPPRPVRRVLAAAALGAALLISVIQVCVGEGAARRAHAAPLAARCA